MIEAAIILSAVIQRWEDFAIIMVLLLMNGVVGFWQESKADKAIELMKKRLALKTRVLRDGKWQSVESRDLAPGDVIRVRLGDIMPADTKLLKGEYLLSDESALTGESLPVEKHEGDVAYSAAIVKQGEMYALVIATGVNSLFGKTTKLVEEAKTQSHFQKAVINTGKEIAKTVGLKTNIVTAETITDKSGAEASSRVEKADGFAQMFPEHKYRIVELPQKKGHIVGMTGDGVNDAPALKKADNGIAVAGATDAAKSAADIVLTKPGLSVIIDAIKESRRIFQRMKSYAIYRIAETIRVLFFIVASILVFNFYPVTALMIVLLALLNDAPIMAIAYDNVRYSKSPERWQMHEVIVLATYLGLIGVFFSFFIFFVAKVVMHLDTATIQSFVFLKLAVAGHLTIFVARTRGHFWSIRPGGALLWSAVGTKILATLVTVYGVFIAPIGWTNAGIVWGYALGAFVITDFVKVQLYEILGKRAAAKAAPLSGATPS